MTGSDATSAVGTDNGVRPYKVFVSSTFFDLRDHRARVIDALRKAGFHVVAMEDWTAAPGEPKAVSVDRIRDCDLFVLLVARRRGHIPEGEEKSITQLEYELAKGDERIDILAFLHSDDEPWLPKFDETATDEQLERWRKELQEHYVVGFFGLEPESLQLQVGPALLGWLEKRRQRGQERDAVSLDEALKVHLHTVVAGLEERRTRYLHDLQRNVLDFYIEARGATTPPPKEPQTGASEAQRLWELLAPSVEERRPCIVLADFGMGKTWFLEHLKYRLAKAALEDAGDPVIPLWVSLRTATDGSSFDELRKQAWIAAFGERLTESREPELVELYEEGRFVFLFDALDEMGIDSRRDQDRFLANLGKLREHSRRSPVVLTCRRSFFTEAAKEERLPDLGFDVFYLWPWSRDDIVSYFENAHRGGVLGVEPTALLERIEQTYDLRDLSSRAMLSAMLAAQWRELTHGAAIDLPSLYERHVEKAVLEWQSQKARRLEKHQIKECMEEIAFLMFRLNSLSISPEELDAYFSRQFDRLRIDRFSEIAESFIRDTRTNSLLLRDGDSYVFCHASIWEFMVARRLARGLENREGETFHVPGRGTQFESVIQEFLIPMLKKQEKLHLIGSLFAEPGAQ